ncbi:MAG: ankyrin repeat domain-containing protein [Acidobacteria bacterium]|nr:ankyrin repeat domain-containing protein [Acidobacteriota bacterium]
MRNRLVSGAMMGLVGAFLVSAIVTAASNATVADAAMNGDTPAVRALLKEAADVNAAQGDGMTALHWAASRGDAELAQVLLFAGANVRAVTRIGAYTPVFLAAKNGRAAVLASLLEAGADVKATSANGTTPLMAAAAAGDVQTVTLLLDKGADVNVAEPVRGNTAAMFAAANDRPTVIELLVRRGADLKATTKVIDLSSLTRERLGFNGGNPPVPGQEGQQGNNRQPPSEAQRAGAPETPAGLAAQAPAGGSGAEAQPSAPQRRAQVAGVDRQFQLNELVAAQGGLTPLLYAVRQDHQRPFRPGADAARERGRSQPRQRQRRLAPLRGAQRAVGTEGAVSAAARLSAAEVDLCRPDEGAPREGG